MKDDAQLWEDEKKALTDKASDKNANLSERIDAIVALISIKTISTNAAVKADGTI